MAADGQKRRWRRRRPNGARNQEEAACLGKVPFPSESGARAALKMYERLGEMRAGEGVDVYPCKFCREWHLGH